MGLRAPERVLWIFPWQLSRLPTLLLVIWASGDQPRSHRHQVDEWQMVQGDRQCDRQNVATNRSQMMGMGA